MSGKSYLTGAERLRSDVRRNLRFLESLPTGAVVLDPTGCAWQESRGFWYRAFGDDQEFGAWELSQLGPFRLMEVVK